MLTKFFFSGFLVWAPFVISGLIILILIAKKLIPNYKYLKFLKKISTIKLAYIVIALTFLFNVLLTVIQYFVWHNSPFAHFFLPPFTPINYFLGYIFLHFWFSIILSFVFSLIFYFIFTLIKKYRDDVVNREELPLILLASLLVGWPKFVVFVPTFFLVALIFSISNLLVFKKKNNSLSWPLIISLIIVFLGGTYLINLLSLSVLII